MSLSQPTHATPAHNGTLDAVLAAAPQDTARLGELLAQEFNLQP